MNGRETTLSKLLTTDESGVQVGPFGSQLHQHEYRNAGIPVVMPKDIRCNRIDYGTTARVSEAKAASLSRHFLEPGDIILPRRGNLNRCAIIEDRDPPTLCGTGCVRIRLPSKEQNPKFFFYYFSQRHVAMWLEGRSMGATMANLNTSIVADLPVPVRSRHSQGQIADTLSSFDDLIEINNRRIKLLEKTARLIYREWFVHLRFPRHENTRIVDGVPEGWRRVAVSEVAEILSGGTPSTKEPSYWNGSIAFFTPKDAESGVYVHSTEKSITKRGLDNCNGRLFPPNTVFVTARGTVGKTNLTMVPMAMNQSCYALSGKHELDNRFLYYSLSENPQILRQQAQGAVFDAIVVDTFSKIVLLLPTDTLATRFAETISPLLSQVEALIRQNNKLSEARNLLLPRLVSGEIEV